MSLSGGQLPPGQSFSQTLVLIQKKIRVTVTGLYGFSIRLGRSPEVVGGQPNTNAASETNFWNSVEETACLNRPYYPP